MNTEDLLAKYESGYKLLVNQLSEVPKEAILYKPTENCWSIAVVVVHLADSEAIGFIRARKIIAECGGKVSVYNKQIWADNLFYDEMNYLDALKLIQILRKNLVSVLKKIAPEIWHNYIYHPETGTFTLLDWIQLHIDHIDIHIHQIRRNLYDWEKEREKAYA